MSIRDQLKSEQKMLERIKAEYKKKLPEWQQKKEHLQSIQGQPGARDALWKFEQDFATWKGIHDQNMENLKKNVEILQEQVNQEDAEISQRARVELKEKKDQALAKWKLNGGTLDSFERAWPSMEAEYLKSKISENDDDQEKLIQKKGEGFGL